MERKNYSPIFSILFALALFLLLLWKVGTLNFISSIVSKIFSAPRGFVVTKINGDNNLDLSKLSKELNIIKLEKENHALSDQFAISSPKSSDLLPSKIVGSPSFIPTVTLPDYFILDKGEKDGVRKGDGVVYRDNLVGQISQTSEFTSKVELVVSKSTSITGKLESGGVGVLKGVGNGLEIDNVLASENLKENDSILTKGSVNISGVGIPPDLIIGKIVSIDQDPSALFQTGKVQSLLDFTKMDMVFIVIK